MKQIFFAVLVIFFIVSFVTVFFTFTQVNAEQERLKNDIEYRSSLLADSLKESVEPNFINKSNVYLQSVVERFTDTQRIAGFAIVDNMGNIVAVSSSLPKEISDVQQIATDVMDSDTAAGDFIQFNDSKMYVFASPLRDQESVVGSLVIIQNAGYIDARLLDIWKNNLLRLFAQSFLVSLAVLFILRWIIFIPIRSLVDALRLTRNVSPDKSTQKIFDNPIFGPLLQEVGNMQQRLIEARIAASEEARLRLKKLDTPWTKERLKAFVSSILKERTIFLVSNREPYIHKKDGNKIVSYVPASGMVTALEPVMQACGGLWIAHGSGSADRLVVDKKDKVEVPPDDPRYTLKRVWLTEEEERGYYLGFANEGIWPLCHIAHTRPVFKKSDWEQYQKVNEKFARVLLEEIKGHKNPIVLIQDFHFALLPRLIKDKRPDAIVGIFWHIPWPNEEAFSICPWKKEMLEGMLGADIVGFHTQFHCNNFIHTVGNELEALVAWDKFTITKDSHKTLIKAFPISIDFNSVVVSKEQEQKNEEEKKELLEKLDVKTLYVGVGVDRLDYTKGILERLKAIELFLNKYPSYIGNFTFIQLASPSRSSVQEYKNFAEQVEQEVERINTAFKQNGWKPIIYLEEHKDHVYINTLYQVANVCLVTSLHDGMNLVSKEFVAARNDEKGVLVLSQFAGSSQELRGALIVNPYNGEQTADTIHRALTMPEKEQVSRMRRMRDVVKNYNVFRWSAELLKTMVDLE
jgi:alpha,alpha-trehalose-phosphate synthase [UDP-forming]